VLVFNDISSVGRCSLLNVIPILSVLKTQVIPITTTILTTHTGGFKSVKSLDLTSFMPEYLKSYIDNGITIDGIYTGYFSNGKQCNIVLDYINHYNYAKIIVDPIMGDNGKIYSKITQNIINGITDLVKIADIVTPNLTEAYILLGEKIINQRVSQDKAIKMLYGLQKLGAKTIVIKGVTLEDNKIYNFVLENNKIYKIGYKLIRQNYPGTGDIFASVIVAEYINKESVKDSAYKATKFLQEVVEKTYERGCDPKYGVEFENHLKLLI